MKFRSLPIRRKVRIVVLLVVVMALGLSASGIFFLQNVSFRERAESELRTLAGLIGVGVNSAVFFGEQKEAARVLDLLRNDSEIVEAHVFLLSGRELFASTPAQAIPPRGLLAGEMGYFPSPEGIWLVQELKDEQGRAFAGVALRSSLRSLRREQVHSLILLGAVTIATLIVAFWLAAFLQRGLTMPLSSLAEMVQQIAKQGDRHLRIPPFPGDEIGSLADNINGMLTTLEQHAQALRESESRNRAIVEALPDLLFRLSVDGVFLDFQVAEKSRLLIPPEQFVGKRLAEVMPDLGELTRKHIQQALQTKQIQIYEYSMNPAGTSEYYEARMVASKGNEVLVLVRDITERKRAEEERTRLEDHLQQVRKMESVGQLAGGVAHDLNNMLSPILGYAELLMDELGSSQSQKESLEQIVKAASRARDLTRQLLAFARKQTLEIKPVDLNQAIKGLEPMLRHTVRENVKIETSLDPSLGGIAGDMGQIEQIILNLAVNAQDAMPEGGTLILETTETFLDEAYAQLQEGVIPGPYILLSVSDTGIGMSKDTLAKIFEPFYTTKEAGRGTGLGLSTVYGIVKQHGGHIRVCSESGRGSTFRIFFPRTDKITESLESEIEQESCQGSETILLAEDQEDVRLLAGKILQYRGYTVLMAASGEEALKVAENWKGVIHILVTDVIMTGINGRELFERLVSGRAGLKVLYMSGYAGNLIGRHGVLDPGVHFIQKPFTLKTFTHKVREVIDSD